MYPRQSMVSRIALASVVVFSTSFSYYAHGVGLTENLPSQPGGYQDPNNGMQPNVPHQPSGTNPIGNPNTGGGHQKGRYSDTTCEFGGRVGNVVFKNDSAYPINVKLWHPDSGAIYTSQTVPGNASTDFGINVGDDWGVQLGSSQIRCIGAVANWANHIFMVNSSGFY